MMGSRWRLALGLGLILAYAPAARAAESSATASEADLGQAKAYLKDYLKELNAKYPFADWEKQAARCRTSLDRLRSKPGFSGGTFDRAAYDQLGPLVRDMQELQKRRADTDKLIKELYVSNLVRNIDGRFFREGKHWDQDAKLAFQRALMPYEGGSLKPKTRFQADVAALDRDFRGIQTAWMFAFAQDFLAHRVEEHLKAHDLARIESLYDDYSLQLDYWTRSLQANAGQTEEQLQKLSKQYEGNKNFLRQNLEGLLEALNTDFLFSDLLEYARKQKVDFTIEVEDKIEASLKERSKSVLAPIQDRIAAWKTFSASLRDRIAQAQSLARADEAKTLVAVREREKATREREKAARDAAREREKAARDLAQELEKQAMADAEIEKRRADAERRAERERADAERRVEQERADAERIAAQERAEDERKERERMEALAREQKRMEAEQKEKFKQTLTELKTFSFKSETSVELDDDSKKALSTKAGFLKTSYVRTGVNKLKVDKALFNDTLAVVQKFTVEEGSVDFSKMSLAERSNQSAYTFVSPAGRTSQGDLENFVAEVALGSFSTYYSFLSYVTPGRWSPGRVAWMPERAGEKANHDREFSYVDLVVDAHRKRSGGSNREESTMNLPANMIVIFDPQGSIIRYQSFADVDQVAIRTGDLISGKLYYKFLNYTTDRQHIYLNGIDSEMKVASPGGKS